MTRLYLAIVFELAFVVVGFAVLPPAAQAQLRAVQCVGSVAGENVAAHTSSSNAIKLDKDERVQLALLANGPVGAVQVEAKAGPWSTSVQPATDRSPLPPTSWSGSGVVSDYARIGVGLYQVSLRSSGGCNLTFWVNVTGASPVATPAGGVAAVALLGGLVIQSVGVLRGRRGRGGLGWALLGGIPTGLGATWLSQQAGLTPVEPTWALIWTVPPAAIGVVLNRVASAFANRGAQIAIRPDERVILHAPPPDVEPSAPTAASPVEMPAASTPSAAPPPVSTPSVSPAPAPLPPVSSRAEPPDDNAVRSLPDADDAASAEPPSPEKDPPRTAYALIECPEAVVAESEFEVTLGLSPAQVEGVAGGVLVRPESSQGAYTLAVQVVADGFSLRDGETWRHELPVTAEAAYPAFTLHLRAASQAEPVRPRAVQAIYSVAGQSMGLAVRAVAVVKSADLLATAPAAPPAEQHGMSVPTNEPAADLTVRIQRGDSEAGGRLLWTFDTPHDGIDLPDAPRATDIGSEPEKFARQLVDGVGVREGQLGLSAYLLGVGRTIADQMPLAFWDLLKQIAARATVAGRQPSVFILSEEPYVPWELAAVEPSLSSDASVPPFLGAQACVGRWVLGQRRPTLPPPFAVHVASMAVVSGEYNQPGWNRLVEAEAEAASIEQAYGAAAVSATTSDVLQCLGGVPLAQALHFAVHGIYDPNSVMNGIVLTDGQTLDPLQVKGSMLSATPFVFLNACQVGSANRVLGDYGGMAEAFLYAGAAGVVAPLWSIKDTIAKEIALRFYASAFDGTPPAEILRRERAACHGLAPGDSATCLAYVWYGHPSLKLNLIDAKEASP